MTLENFKSINDISSLINKVDKSYHIELIEKIPCFIPKIYKKFWKEKKFLINWDDCYNSNSKYLYLISKKLYSAKNVNLPKNDFWYKTHLKRSKENVKDIKGTLLDIGSDNIKISKSIFPKSVKYLGYEPIYNDSEHFYVIGLAEYLPFRNKSFDNVCFNTSLDHILDYYKALQEAKRVLKDNGSLIINSLIWNGENSELSNDDVHFHHFKLFEIEGALYNLNFTIKKSKTYVWKNEIHRKSIYITAEKNEI